jgi:hypothetical protein
MPDTAPLVQTIQATVPAATIAATQDQVIGEAPFDGTVTAVKLVPEAALTGNATNYRTFRVVNKGQAGAGTTVVASLATDATPAKDLVAFDEKTIPLSVVAGATTVAAGDVLAVDETVAASGIAHSGYRIIVEITRS